MKRQGEKGCIYRLTIGFDLDTRNPMVRVAKALLIILLVFLFFPVFIEPSALRALPEPVSWKWFPKRTGPPWLTTPTGKASGRPLPKV